MACFFVNPGYVPFIPDAETGLLKAGEEKKKHSVTG